MNESYLQSIIDKGEPGQHLSRYITYGEIIASQTAIRHGIDNTPTVEHLQNAQLLAGYIIDPIREYYGEPFIASSFYRCDELNRRVGGSPTSDHKEGRAVDFDYERFGISNKRLLDNIVNDMTLDFDQVIYEYGQWIHISYSKTKKRGMILVKYHGKAYQSIRPEQIKDL